jgi:hypothetical protein
MRSAAALAPPGRSNRALSPPSQKIPPIFPTASTIFHFFRRHIHPRPPAMPLSFVSQLAAGNGTYDRTFQASVAPDLARERWRADPASEEPGAGAREGAGRNETEVRRRRRGAARQ